MKIQVRSESTGMREYATLREAIIAGEHDITIWKISFPIESGERVRLIRVETYPGNYAWLYESVLEH